MLALSFRTKLILAMSVIVTGVTGATMIVTQQRVQATYQRLFEEQFRSQISYFSERQSERLAAVAAKCEEMAKSVRLSSAIEEGDPKLVYDNVFTELRVLFELTGAGGGEGTPAGNASRLGNLLQRPPAVAGSVLSRRAAENTPIVRVLDAKGQLMPTADLRAGMTKKNPLNKLRSEQIKALMGARSANDLRKQEIGYLAIEGEDAKVQLREFIITPVINVSTGQRLGALMLGFPIADFGERAMFDMSKRSEFGQIVSGIWLDANIYSQTIPEPVRSPLALRIAREIVETGIARDDFIVDVEDVPHRVFYKVLNPGSTFPAACQVCLFSLQSVLAEQRDLRLRIGGFGAVALAGALVLILLISHGLTVPIQQLVRGTHEIKLGNFAVKVPVRSRDEVGQLTASFNEMAEGLALSKRYQSVLSQVADKEVAEAMMKGEVALGGELREVSVLFCDIRGFTALTQGMPPAEVIAMLNEHMTALTAVVYEHQGVVDKFVGDLIMAVFGAPKSYGNDAHNAARCALRMIVERTKLNETSSHKIAVGIGVATGTAVAGCMGSSDRLNYTVLGERVNLASRLCGVAGRMEVVIDETTRQKLAAYIKVESLPELRLKGFSDHVSAYKLSQIHSRPQSE